VVSIKSVLSQQKQAIAQEAAELPEAPDVTDLVRRAIVTNTITLAYQPVVQSNNPSKIAFYEGLIRVPDDAGKIIPAAKFIDRIERNSLGRMVDCCALQAGLAELTAQPWLRLSINASPLSIVDPLWQATLRYGLEEDARLAERLIIEVTETTEVADMAQFAQDVNAVRQQGVSFALDDFGAGYTSFRILKEVRFDIIKIDGHFIRDIHTNRDNQALTKALIDIAGHFEMMAVAEAVEKQEEMAFLREMNVDCQQGYLFGRPEITPIWADKTEVVGLPG
jgi:EAL domain-containing protein (putative c-di-GMP-specific phosphodiesterase class I)